MAESMNISSLESESIAKNGIAGPSNSGGVAQSSELAFAPDEIFDELSGTEEELLVSMISDEDVSSLIEPSLSHIAARLKSAKTPAIEKTAAMEESGGYFDEISQTPPEILSPEALERDSTAKPLEEKNVPIKNMAETSARLNGFMPPVNSASYENRQDDILATTIHASSSQPKELQPQSSLAGAFDGRCRSSSGGPEALKKLMPKGLPSMPSISQVGNLFGYSNTGQKPKFSSTFPKETLQSYGRSISSGIGSLSGESTPRSRFEPIHDQAESNDIRRPGVLRRATSDDSLLYNSLSRASSLGDDARFENHREQVNSRVKAIRDSLQDRSSFRMPQIPSMPSMPRVPNFGFNMNFLSHANVPLRFRSNTDASSDLLPAILTKKKPINGLATAPAMVVAAVSKPEADMETARPVADGSNSPFLDQAMEHLTGDIVIMGGYRGSILRSTRTGRQVWVPVKVGLNIRKVDLEVGLEPEDEERMSETIYSSGMLQNIGPVDISKRLFKRLSECENAKNGTLRVWDYGYDWRLSPHFLSRNLTQFLEKLPSNQPKGDPNGNKGALVIAHSLGGLLTRWVVNHKPSLFSGVIYAGVPQSCVNILGPLRNGDAVLLSSRVLTAQVNFTLRTSFVLLPEDGGCFFDINTREKYPVDFFNINDWIKYRWSPCTDQPLPPRIQQTGHLGTLLNMSGSLLSLPVSGKKSTSGSSTPLNGNFNGSRHGSPTKTSHVADALQNLEVGGKDRTIAPQMGGNTNPVNKGHSTNSSVSTTVTIPRGKAIEYLRRTLAETKRFKRELHFKPELEDSNQYPPVAVIYGKSIPTVFGAKVHGREGIPCSDCYDNLAFASGDGVCLAKEAMLPPGYKSVNGGRISSDRGHVTLLGDLNAIGRAIGSVTKGREKGIGIGVFKG